ncbi:MAG: cation diffusion facilitator family transporter [Thermoplasmata archaeon]
MNKSSSVVLFALFSNIFLTLGKFIVAIISGSAGLMAEFFHSSSDTLNQLLLLLGIKKSTEKDRLNFPFGKGKEQYFWSFIASIVFIEVSGMLSLVEGYLKMQHPYLLENISYVTLIIVLSFVLEGAAFLYTLSVMRKNVKVGGYTHLREYIRDIRDSILLNAFMEDLGALIGMVIISTGFLFSLLYHNSLFDAISSIGVGILLIIIGIYLAGINKDLLLGKGLTSRDREKIIRIIKETKNVNGIVNMDGIYMGPSSIIIGLDLNFKDGLTTEEIENTIDTIEKRIRAEIPYVRRIYIEAEEVRKSI